MSTEERENAEKLAKELGELTVAIVRILPAETEDEAKEYLEIIKGGMDAAVLTPPGSNPVKDITENVVDVMDAIGDVIPDSTDKKKQRQKRNYKSALGIIRNFLNFFNLG